MEFGEFFRTWRDDTLKAYSKMMQPAIESEGFVKAMNASTDAVLTAQKQARETQVKALEAMNVPTREQLAELSHQVQLAEKRALHAEDRAEAAETRTKALEQRVDGVLAALAAAQGRLAKLQASIEAAGATSAKSPTAATEPPPAAAKKAAPPSKAPTKSKGRTR
jgi:predicted  nucleic acid-binding Zn-ribbon protein